MCGSKDLKLKYRGKSSIYEYYSWFIFIEQVHLDYLEAGADIIITASYQVISSFVFQVRSSLSCYVL